MNIEKSQSRERNYENDEKVVSKSDLVRMRPHFHSEIVKGGYLDKLVTEYEDRENPLILQEPGLRNYGGNDLAICDRCNLVYRISFSRDLHFEKKKYINVPYCEPCSITMAIKDLID